MPGHVAFAWCSWPCHLTTLTMLLQERLKLSKVNIYLNLKHPTTEMFENVTHTSILFKWFWTTTKKILESLFCWFVFFVLCLKNQLRLPFHLDTILIPFACVSVGDGIYVLADVASVQCSTTDETFVAMFSAGSAVNELVWFLMLFDYAFVILIFPDYSEKRRTWENSLLDAKWSIPELSVETKVHLQWLYFPLVSAGWFIAFGVATWSEPSRFTLRD